jgi:hypothetical protein
MQETNQDLKQLLHKLNLPRSAGAVPAGVGLRGPAAL